MAFADDIVSLGATAHHRFNATSAGAGDIDIIGSDDLIIGAGVTLNQAGGGDDGDAAVEFDGTSTGSYLLNISATDGGAIDANTRSDQSHFIAFYLDTNAADQLIYQQGGKGAGFFLYTYGSDSKLYLNLTDGTVNNSGSVAISASAWHSVLIVQDDASDLVTVYVDGSLAFTVDISSLSAKAYNRDFFAFGDAQAEGSHDAYNVRIHTGAQWTAADGKILDGKIDESAHFSAVVLSSTNASDLHDVWLNVPGTQVESGVNAYDLGFTSSNVGVIVGDDPSKIALSIESVDKLALSMSSIDKLSLSLESVDKLSLSIHTI